MLKLVLQSNGGSLLVTAQILKRRDKVTHRAPPTLLPQTGFIPFLIIIINIYYFSLYSPLL